MPGTDHQNPLDRRRRIRLLPGAARAAATRCRRWCWPARCTASTRTSASSPTNSPATASSPRRPICSGGRCRGRSATTTSAPRSARSRGWRRSRPASATWSTRWRISARCRSSTAAPRRWASATAGPTPSSGRSGSATTPASPATARRCSTTSGELDGVTEPVCIIWGDQDHRAPPEVLDAYRPVPSRMKNVEVHIFPGILHGYMMPGSTEGLRPEDARLLDEARRWRSSTGCAAAARPCARRRSVGCCTAVTATPTSLFGRRMTRVEDAPLLRGQGRFVDDLDIPGALHVAFLRSPVAHGRLKGIDASAAKALPGVHAVLTFADLRPLLTSDRIPQALPSGAIRFHVDPCARQGRSHLRRRAGRDGGGREPPRRRGRARLDRARSRGAAGGDRSGRGARARRAQGPAGLPGQSRGAAEHRLRRHRRRVRQGRASHQASTSACTRAAAIRSRRAASRCGSIRSTVG